MAESKAPAAATTAPKSEASVFVDALYRKVLLAVKASNAIPSEDDDYHYHCKFSTAFASQVTSTGSRVQDLLWQLSKSSKDNEKDDDASDDEDGEDSKELFEGPEPKSRITDLVDTLLDEASKQLDIVARGGNERSSNTKTLENKPMVFDKKQQKTKETETDRATAAATRLPRATNKPQDQFEEKIDNSDAPFVSKLREKVHAVHDAGDIAIGDDEDEESAELARQHPYYAEIHTLKYADWQLEASSEPYKKIPVENASYMWVNTPEKLTSMMTSLTKAEARVIAIDLEHHSYRSYLGLVCLMQISTATEDFLVDTLALRSQLQILNEVFCDPAKVKVLHGSDMDILWLQRDLGLYVVNMFDTGQAARLLNYPRFSLAYLLKRHCNIDADKQYQLADWRIRPLDRNMTKYAREDTRYLLYIYDQMKQELLQASDNTRSSLLFEALQNSSKLCLQVYVKPRITDDECQALSDKLKATAGLPELSELQKRVFERLFYWRDQVARAEDESHAYVMPNHVLIKITKELPLRSDQLFRTCHPVPALVRRHAHELTSMISTEKSKLAAEEGKPASSSIAPRQQKITSQKRKFDDDGVMESATFTTIKPLSEYAGWESGKRKAKEASTSTTLSLHLSFSKVSVAEEKASSGLAALEKVKELVASTAFVVAEYGVESMEVEGAQEIVETSKASLKVEPQEPKSIAETYNLSKRRKIQGLDTSIAGRGNTKSREEDESDVKQEAVKESNVKAFDYAAASQQIAGAQFKLEEAAPARTQHKHKGKKKVGGRGYNPFVAVRGGNAASQTSEKESAPVGKKIHHMPRSSTFR
ncbi:hypothetical protein Poli38472_009014 [Pythium oligandrum]|uniref:HRDC domain-containing protein n=1 Tax=Pythium oligandrum TaxID=41045 RepID=A0A8K1FMG7_PYTOL|nr:hypothetical protein Poli38472_009014 [Pythium oligandrum]|eukprot:TMW64847.1 hypothetical protein Poli38472_009014 [Pythium oligandrum]